MNQDTGTWTALVRFDLDMIPSDAVVRSATLELFADAVAASGAPDPDLTTSAHLVLLPWDEATLVDDSIPRLRGIEVARGTPSTGVWLRLDLTQTVRGWVSEGGNHGLAIDSLLVPLVVAVFTSRESTDPPRLILLLAGEPVSLPQRIYVPAAQSR